jgi:hypothetical protein
LEECFLVHWFVVFDNLSSSKDLLALRCLGVFLLSWDKRRIYWKRLGKSFFIDILVWDYDWFDSLWEWIYSSVINLESKTDIWHSLEPSLNIQVNLLKSQNLLISSIFLSLNDLILFNQLPVLTTHLVILLTLI